MATQADLELLQKNLDRTEQELKTYYRSHYRKHLTDKLEKVQKDSEKETQEISNFESNLNNFALQTETLPNEWLPKEYHQAKKNHDIANVKKTKLQEEFNTTQAKLNKIIDEQKHADDEASENKQAQQLLDSLQAYQNEIEFFEKKKKAEEAAQKKETAKTFAVELGVHGGTISFVTGIFIEVIKTARDLASSLLDKISPYFSAIGGPIAIASIAFNALRGGVTALFGKTVAQRKTLGIASLLTLGLAAVALTIAVGAIITAPYTLPLLFLGILTVGFIQQCSVIYNLEKNIKTKEQEIEDELENLSAEIDDVVEHSTDDLTRTLNEDAKNLSRTIAKLESQYKQTDDKDESKITLKQEIDLAKVKLTNTHNSLRHALHEDPKIQRLCSKQQKLRFEKEKLVTLKEQAEKARWRQGAMIGSVVLLILGIAFPPLIALAAVGGLLLTGFGLANSIIAKQNQKTLEKMEADHKEALLNPNEDHKKIITEALDKRAANAPIAELAEKSNDHEYSRSSNVSISASLSRTQMHSNVAEIKKFSSSSTTTTYEVSQSASTGNNTYQSTTSPHAANHMFNSNGNQSNAQPKQGLTRSASFSHFPKPI